MFLFMVTAKCYCKNRFWASRTNYYLHLKTAKKVHNASKPKERELYHAGHLDALVYRYYAELLTK
jgi:hypothetical protein